MMEPVYDFNMRRLRKGERVSKGWRVVTITKEDLHGKKGPVACKCGCGYSYRVGDRFAVRNIRIVGHGAPLRPRAHRI